jgi:cation diffusion facilitator family transporter
MTRFPPAIPLPDFIDEARKLRMQEIIRSAWIGISIRALIIIFELAGFVLFDSYAILLDALSSTFDVASSVFLVLCIKLASKPPDEDHPFGHGRYEPLIGLQLGVLLAFIGSSMVFQQVFQVAAHTERENISPWAWVIPMIAVLFLELSYHVVIRVAKKQNSPALAADAVHYRMDSITSLFAALALICGAFFPQISKSLDHVGAIVIALIMIAIGFSAARMNLHQLMDRIPSPEFFDLVRTASLNVPGVLGTEKIRIQNYGPDAHVNIDIEVQPDLTVEKAHSLSQKVRAEIQKQWPAVRDVSVHIEPYYPNDH